MKVWKGRAGVVRQEGDSKWQVLCVRWGNAVLLRVMRKLLMMMLLELQSDGREARAMQLLEKLLDNDTAGSEPWLRSLLRKHKEGHHGGRNIVGKAGRKG